MSLRAQKKAATPPVRVPRQRGSRWGCTGPYRTASGETWQFESLLERDAMVVLDIDPAFERFQAQPVTWRWRDDRKARSYTPDFRVERSDGGAVFLQIKPEKRLAGDPTLDGRLPWIDAHCASQGASHEIWTESEIRAEPRFSNVQRIRTALRSLVGVPPPFIASIVETLKPPCSLSAVCDAMSRRPGSYELALALVAKRILLLEVAAPLTLETQVCFGHRPGQSIRG